MALAGQRQPLMHAEAVLLVDDRKCQIAKGDVVLEQRVGADHQIDIAGGERRQHLGAFAAALAAGQDGEADAGRGRERRDGGEMLPRQDFGRRHQRRLTAGLDDVAAASSATTVLPEPTSPCSSRNMRCGCARSATMSAVARCCDGVSE